MKIKLGICNFCVPGTGVFAPEIVSELGLDGMSIEFGPYTNGWPLSQRDLQNRYLNAREKYGIEYCNIGVSDGDNIPFHARKGTKEDQIVDLEADKAVDAAAYMGIPCVFFSHFRRSENRTQEDLERTAERYRRICDCAQEKEIQIACEMPNSSESQKILVQMVDRENFSLLYDSGNYEGLTDFDGYEILKELYPSLSNQMHIKDGMKGENASRILGTGNARFLEKIRFLKEKKFSGWLILENLYEQKPMRDLNPSCIEILKEDIKWLKEAVKDF
ncbi:MAG: sugar phosphate isomerase/epimerase family protein [Bilifractor sp.]